MESNSASSPENTALDNTESALLVAHIEPLRDKQKEIIDSGIKDNELTAALDETVKSYLVDQGINSDNSKYNDLYSTLRDLSYDRIDGARWVGEYENESLGTFKPYSSGIDEIHRRQEALFGRRLDGILSKTTPDGTAEKTEAVEAVMTEIDTTRKKYAEMLAKRSKKTGLFELGKSVKAMESAREELSDMISALATEMMLELEASGVPNDEIVRQIDEFVSDNMSATIAEMEQNRAADFQDRSRLVKWGLSKWASWGPKEDATRRQRIIGNMKKGLVFAAPGAAIGAGFAFAGGLIGAGAIVVGASTMLSRSIARNIAGAKLDSAADAETIAHKHSQEIQHKMDEAESQVHYDLLKLAEEQAGVYRRQNQKRLLAGTVISLAFAGGSGALIHGFLSDHNLISGKIGDKISELSRRDAPANTVPKPPAQSPLGDPSLGPKGDRGLEQILHPPEAPKTVSLPQFDVEKYIGGHHAGEVVDNGEGWYQTFQELGVDDGHKAALLQELGPKLVERGVAYQQNGEFFIANPGALPHDVSTMIVETAHGHGWLTGEQQLPPVSAGLRTIDQGEGVLQSLHEAGVEQPTMQDVANVGTALEQAGVGYHAPNLGGTGLYYHDGVMSDKGVQIFQDYADNRLLDNSISMKTAASIDADAVDATVKAFATEHNLGNNISSLNDLVIQAKSNGVSSQGLEAVIAAGDVNHSGSVADEVQNYLNQFSANRTSFMDAMQQASSGRGVDKLAQYATVIDSVGKELSAINYLNPDGTTVPAASYNSATGHYQLASMQSGMPANIRNLIQNAAFRSDYRLAA